MIINIVPLKLQTPPMPVKYMETLSGVLIMSISHTTLKFLYRKVKEG